METKRWLTPWDSLYSRLMYRVDVSTRQMKFSVPPFKLTVLRDLSIRRTDRNGSVPLLTETYKVSSYVYQISQNSHLVESVYQTGSWRYVKSLRIPDPNELNPPVHRRDDSVYGWDTGTESSLYGWRHG